jgi:hypothetical protein
MFLRDYEWKEELVDSLRLAQSVTSSATKPDVVSFNLYNSSARTAAFTVALGAKAALGFQDYIDDRLAEIFFAEFYWQWRNAPGNPVKAFQQALHKLRGYGEPLWGTGIVLWTRHSLAESQTPWPEEITSAAGEDPNARAPGWIEPAVVPRKKLNYAILQNNKQPLFSKFSIYKYRRAPVPDLHVEVELQIGSERFPFRRTCKMDHHVLDLSEDIGLGLTSPLVRSLHESIRSTLFVHVATGAEEILRETYNVNLLPIDEWRADDENRIWLPSFILPRDPAVLQVLMRAQQYLVALRDDASASFDGYQSLGQIETRSALK